MLTDFQNFLTVGFSVKFATKYISFYCDTLKVLLHYLAKHKRPKVAKFYCTYTITTGMA